MIWHQCVPPPYRSTALGDDIPLANEIQHTVNSVCCIDNRKDWLCESKGQTTEDRRAMRNSYREAARLVQMTVERAGCVCPRVSSTSLMSIPMRCMRESRLGFNAEAISIMVLAFNRMARNPCGVHQLPVPCLFIAKRRVPRLVGENSSHLQKPLILPLASCLFRNTSGAGSIVIIFFFCSIFNFVLQCRRRAGPTWQKNPLCIAPLSREEGI